MDKIYIQILRRQKNPAYPFLILFLFALLIIFNLFDYDIPWYGYLALSISTCVIFTLFLNNFFEKIIIRIDDTKLYITKKLFFYNYAKRSFLIEKINEIDYATDSEQQVSIFSHSNSRFFGHRVEYASDYPITIYFT